MEWMVRNGEWDPQKLTTMDDTSCVSILMRGSSGSSPVVRCASLYLLLLVT